MRLEENVLPFPAFLRYSEPRTLSYTKFILTAVLIDYQAQRDKAEAT
jgi:hypothetical protein